MIAAAIVTMFGGINVQGIRPLYLVQLAVIAFIIFFVVFMLKNLQSQSAMTKFKSVSKNSLIEGFRELFKEERWLKQLLMIWSLRMFGMSVSTPFNPLWMVDVKGADPYILGVMGTLGTVASALLYIPIGRLSDKSGRKKVFLMLRPFSYLSTILLILAPNPESLIMVGILAGIGNVSFVPFITMYWEAVPAEKMGRWFGITSLFEILIVPAPILGGFIWQAGLMELTLLIPVLIEALIVIPLLTRVPDTLGRSK